MIALEPLQALSRDDLLDLVAELQRQVAELTASHEALRIEIERLKRNGKRQAAPLSKGTRAMAEKPPGRKPGAGPFHYRDAPPPDAITESPVDVTVTLEACPALAVPWKRSRSTAPIAPSAPNALAPR